MRKCREKISFMAIICEFSIIKLIAITDSGLYQLISPKMLQLINISGKKSRD